jgi:transposase-like protein
MKEKKKNQIRRFSEAFKREKVKEIEGKTITVLQLSRIYEVSQTAIYKWIRKYSKYIEKRERVVVEKESESLRTYQLQRKIAELERLLGQKDVELSYLEKVIEAGNELLGEDLKKKYDPKS